MTYENLTENMDSSDDETIYANTPGMVAHVKHESNVEETKYKPGRKCNFCILGMFFRKN